MLLQGLVEEKKWYRDGNDLANSAVMSIGKSKVLSFVKKKKKQKKERRVFNKVSTWMGITTKEQDSKN